jgi:isopenicillin N synthase-like dioxygenase
MTGLPVVHLDRWLDGTDRSGVAAAVDEAFSDLGFLVVVGHGIDPALVADTRRVFAEFFTQPDGTKQAVRMPRLGMAGWAPMGMEANGYSFGQATPPDFKESYRLGAHELPGRVALRGHNVWPTRPAGFRHTVLQYLAAVDALHLELLRVCAAAIGLDDPEFFASRATRNDNTLNVNWYAPISRLGAPVPGQYRIGPHTDFGSITVLHREPGTSALEVQAPDGSWVHAPVVDDSFTVNAGDLLEHWSGGRWRSAVHRILPPHPGAVEESMLSLVYFCEPDPDTWVQPLDGDGAAVLAGEHLRRKIEAISSQTTPDAPGA